MPAANHKTVLITGCSSGIGLATADGLRARGYRVFATARAAPDVAKLKAQGYEASRLDLTDNASIHQAMDETLAATGEQLFALFNNGAYGQMGALEDLPTDALRRQFEANVFGWHELTRRVLPVMRRQGYGRVIQNSSVLGLVALKYRGAYTASKFAIEALADTLRLEFLGSDIHFVLIEPGPIQTRFRANALRAFEENIDAKNSAHGPAYRAFAQKLAQEGPTAPGTLPPQAVADKVIAALEAKRPKIRYYVTAPTYLFGYLKRILPARLMDQILKRL